MCIQQNVSTRCLIPYTLMLMDGRLYLDKIKPTFDLLIAANVHEVLCLVIVNVNVTKYVQQKCQICHYQM